MSRFRLTIEGDEDLLRQISDAMDLQGHLLHGNFDLIERTFISALYLEAQAQGTTLTQQQQSELNAFRQALKPVLKQLGTAHFDALHAAGASIGKGGELVKPEPTLPDLRIDMGRTQKRAYAVWKWIEYYRNQLQPGGPRDNVHAKVYLALMPPDVAVHLMKLPDLPPAPPPVPERKFQEIEISWEDWFVLQCELGISDTGKLTRSNGAVFPSLTDHRLAIVGYLNERTAYEAFEIIPQTESKWGRNSTRPFRYDARNHYGMRITGKDGTKFVICAEAVALVHPPVEQLKDEGTPEWWEKRRKQ